MKNHVLIISTISVCLLLVSSISTSAVTNDLVFVRSDVGVSRACTYYQLVNNDIKDMESETIKSVRIADKDNDGYRDGIKEVIGTMSDPRWEYYINEDYDCSSVDMVPVVTCEDVVDNATISKVCTTAYVEAPIGRSCNRNVWVNVGSSKLDDRKISVAEKGQVRFCAKIVPEYTENGWEVAIDHIPEFDGVSYPEYAWWLVAWTVRYPIEINANGTSPVMHDGHFVRIPVDVDSMIAAGDLQADLGDLRMVNDSDDEIDIWVDRNDYYANATIGFNATSLGNTYYLYMGNAGAANFDRYNLTHWIRWGDDFDYVTGTDQPSSLIWSNLHADDKVNAVGYTSGTAANVSFRMANWGGNNKMLFGNGFARGVFEGSLSTQTGSGGADGYVILGVIGGGGSEMIHIIWGDVLCTGANMVCYEDVGGVQDWINIYPNSYIKLKVTWDTTNNLNNFTLYNDTFSASLVGVTWKGAEDNLTIIKKFGGYLTSFTYWDNVFVRDLETYYYEPIVQLGLKEAGAVAIGVTVIEPTNKTYNSTTIRIKGTATANANISYAFNGGANITIGNNTAAFSILSSIGVNANAGNKLMVYVVAEDDATDTDSSTVYLSVDTTPPTVIIANPAYASVARENTSIPLDFSAADHGGAASGVSVCRYMINEGANQTIAGCNNGTITTLVESAGNHSLAVYGIDVVNNQGNDSVIFRYDPFLNFSVNDSTTGVDLQSFSMELAETGDSWATTNGSLSIPLSEIGYGNRTFTFSSTEYSTINGTETTTNTSKFNNTYTMTRSYVNVEVFDEGDAAIGIWTNITFNITMTNATNSQTWYNRSMFNVLVNDSVTGDVTVAISSYGYIPRTYYEYISPNSTTNLIAYLLQTADSLLVRFHIHDSSDVPISDALVIARRFINDTWTTVGESTSDEAGVAAIYLNPLASHQITVSATGYTTSTKSITPSTQDYYFYLSSDATTEYHVTFENITYQVLPDMKDLQTNVSYMMDFNITSTDSSLEWFSMNITYNDTIAVFYGLESTANGGNITYFLNSSYTTGNYTMVIKFKKVDFGEYTRTYTYKIINIEPGAGSLKTWFDEFRTADVPDMFKQLFAIMVAWMAAAGVSSMGMKGGGALSFFVLLSFTIGGWFSWSFMMLTALTLISAYAIKEGI